ncbi:MAG: lytic murein transglycosylase [Desulfobacteraceae bacterium]|jgi:membrane-bound lytic murein transglycosylase B
MRKKTKQILKYLILSASILSMLGMMTTPAAARNENKALFEKLQTRLIKDGFDPKLIKRIYDDEKVFFETKGVSAYFRHSEASLDYKKMTQKSWIRKGRVYLREQASVFERAEKQYGVDPNIIAAIILVETKFGRYLGNSSIINILSTMASLTEAPPREYLWDNLPEKRRFERNRYDQKADRKSKWAYKELKAFITYTSQHQIDPTGVKGSYAGALGIAQFMPSNILAYGKDGNGDGRIDLFEDADAIISIASYLKHYGWKPGLDRKKAYKVVYHYNHSKYYVNTILEIAQLLKG